MGHRRIRRDQRLADMTKSRMENGLIKRKERARREARLAELVKAGTFPYTPTIMSWLSAELGKPSRQITPEDVAKVVKS